MLGIFSFVSAVDWACLMSVAFQLPEKWNAFNEMIDFLEQQLTKVAQCSASENCSCINLRCGFFFPYMALRAQEVTITKKSAQLVQQIEAMVKRCDFAKYINMNELLIHNFSIQKTKRF